MGVFQVSSALFVGLLGIQAGWLASIRIQWQRSAQGNAVQKCWQVFHPFWTGFCTRISANGLTFHATWWPPYACIYACRCLYLLFLPCLLPDSCMKFVLFASSEAKGWSAHTHDTLTTRPQTAPRRRRKLTEQQQLEEEFRKEVERELRPPSLTQATLMGCRVELDGGTAPKARMKATTFPPNLCHGGDASGRDKLASNLSHTGQLCLA
eukprot:scaffold157182_cov19-Tisochrysis_lutea.AAC.2